MQQLDRVVSDLRDGGFRITPQRMAIVEYILGTEDHPSAEKIYGAVKKKHPMVSLSTVYKTLDLLRSKNLVNEIGVGGEARYDAHLDEHINLICMGCGRIEDVDEGAIKEVRARVAKKSRYRVVRASFEMHGYCAKCRRQLKE